MSGVGDYTKAVITLNIRRKLKKEKKCYINGRSNINFSNCEFEGYNKVEKFTVLNHVSFGLGTYISENSTLVHTEIGRYCAIGPNVHIINGRHPAKTFVSIHPCFYSTTKQAGFTYVTENHFNELEYVDKEKGMLVRIGNDVWVGDGASIMEGVRVADGTIIGAGAVVVKDTEPYSINGGIPAKQIRYRFAEEDIEFLLKLQWWNKEKEWIQQYARYFYDIKRLRQEVEKGWVGY